MIQLVTLALVCTYCASDAGKASGSRAGVTLADLLPSVRHIARCAPRISPVSPAEGLRGGCPPGQPWDLHDMGGLWQGGREKVARAELSCSDLVTRDFKQERLVSCVFRTGGRGSGHSQQRQQPEQRHGGMTLHGRFGTVSSHHWHQRARAW